VVKRECEGASPLGESSDNLCSIFGKLWITVMACDIFGKIREARLLFSNHGQAMASDRELSELLLKYRKAIEKTHQVMNETSVISTCTACAAQRPGSCCAAGVEEWYDELLLLINLLMECDVGTSRFEPDQCLFIGPKGCKLLARHHFCVNYLCSQLTDVLGKDQIQKLRSVSGEELFIGWTIEQALRVWLEGRE